MNKTDQASLWQRAEMLRGMTQDLDRAVVRLANRLQYGADSIPSAEASTDRPRREGLGGSLEDTYDDISFARDRLLTLAQTIGERGEGPRGELKTERPRETRDHPPFAESHRGGSARSPERYG